MPLHAEIPCLHTLPDGSLLLRLYVQPRGGSNVLIGLQGDMLKLRLNAPPVDGKANKALIVYLAKLFHLPQSALTLKSGHQCRRKTLVLKGADEQEIRSLLVGLLFARKSCTT